MAEKQLPKEVQIAISAAEQVRDRAKQVEIEAEADMESKQQTLAALGTLSAAGALNTQSDLQSKVLTALLENLQHDMNKKRAKEDKEEEEMRRLIEARNNSLKIERAQRLHTQSVCDHKKENGRTRICGQKLSSGDLALMCNLCYRTFDQNTCPPHLIPSGDVIGG